MNSYIGFIMELNELIIEKHNAERSMEGIGENINKLQKLLDENKELLKKKELDFKEENKKYKELVSENESLKTRIEGKRQRLQMLKSPTLHEVETFEHEIASMETKIEDNETQGIELLLLIDEADADLKEFRKKVADLDSSCTNDLNRYEKQLAGLNKSVEDISKKIIDLTDQLGTNEKMVFNLISGKMYPPAAVVDKQSFVCSVCKTKLSGQVIDDISSRSDLVQCPGCGRIIYTV